MPGRTERKPFVGHFAAQAEDPAVEGGLTKTASYLAGSFTVRKSWDSDQPALGFAALRALGGREPGLAKQRKVRIDFDTGNSRFDPVTGVAPEFHHSGRRGWKQKQRPRPPGQSALPS